MRQPPVRGARKVTIRDVAAAAGVSVTTVSHALNDKGKIDPSTRARVLKAAEELGYRASRAARALRSGRTGTIVLLMPALELVPIASEMLSLDYYMQIATAAARTAFGRDHPLLLAPPLDSLEELRALGVDGGIVCDPATGDVRIGLFEALDLPVVSVERDAGRPDMSWYVRSDNEANTRGLLDHLAEAGARRIALLAAAADWAWAQECEAAYHAWCSEHGREPLIAPAGLHDLERSAYQATTVLLESTEPPDAIVALAERYSTGVVRAAREHGLEIPRDLLVATGIDSHQAREGDPAITAVDLQPALQGAAAAELLIARIEGRRAEAPRITPAVLRERASTTRSRRAPGRRRSAPGRRRP